MDFIDDVNKISELSTRFACYRTLVEKGFDKNQAAFESAELTINFSRMGTWSPVFKAFYGFIQPGIAGVYKNVRTLRDSPRARKAVALHVVAGMVTGLLSKMIGGEKDKWMNDFVKNTRVAVTLPDGSNLSLWRLGYSYAPYFAIGRQMVDVAFGDKTIDEAGKAVLDTAITSYLPFDDTRSLMPTLIKPVDDIMRNKNFYGGSIHPPYGSGANYKNYRDDSSWASITMSEALYKLSGGNIDVYPDDLDYLGKSYFGGPEEIFVDTLTTGKALISGEKVLPSNIPLLQEFYREAKPASFVYDSIFTTLDKVNKDKDIGNLEESRYWEAIRVGKEQGVLTDKKADQYSKDFLRSKYLKGDLQEGDKTKFWQRLEQNDDIISKEAQNKISMDFLKQEYNISGSITGKNNVIKIMEMPKEEREKLSNSYTESTKNIIDKKAKEIEMLSDEEKEKWRNLNDVLDSYELSTSLTNEDIKNIMSMEREERKKLGEKLPKELIKAIDKKAKNL